MYNVIGDTTLLTNEEWKALRVIGGSTVGAIMGFNHYTTPYMVWEQFVTGEMPDIDNKHTRYGKLIEPVLRDWFEAELKLEKGTTEIIIQENTDVMQSPTYDFLTGNIDGDIFIPDLGWGVLEIKTASAYAKAFEDGEIPDSYYCQIQYYMWLTGRQYGYMVWLKDKELNYLYIERNELFVSNMLEVVVEFWNEFVLKEIPPPFQGTKSEEELICDKWRVSNPDKVIEMPELEFTLESLLATKERIKELETQKLALENELKFVMQDAEVCIIGDKQVTWRTSKKWKESI